MKKFIAILVVFALIAGTAFAQASISGKLFMGTMMDFTGDVFGSGEMAIGPGVAKTDWDNIRPESEVAVSYAFPIGLNAFLKTDMGGAVKYGGSYYGSNFSFAFGAETRFDGSATGMELEDTWGRFNFMDSQLEILAAVTGPWSQIWRADNAVDIGDGWESFCCRSGIRIKFEPINVPGLSLGLVLPSTTYTNKHGGDGFRPWMDDLFGMTIAQFFHRSLLGMKFGIGNLDIAMMLQFNLHFYVGVTYNFNMGLSIGGSFYGIFADGNIPAGENSNWRGGVTVAYSNDTFGVSLPMSIGIMETKITVFHNANDFVGWNMPSINNNGDLMVKFGPKVYFNIVKSSLRLILDSGIGIDIGGSNDPTFMVRPGIHFNTAGTGATERPNTGIILDGEFTSFDGDFYVTTNLAFRYSF